MSELSSSQCGCRENKCDNNCGCRSNNIIWIILLLALIGNDGSIGFSNGCGCSSGCGCSNGFGNLFGKSSGSGNCCELIILLLILSSCCGNGSFCS